MKHIVLFSGGLGSYFTAKRLIEQGINKQDIILLFTDTKVEDEDLYRFLDDATKKLGIPLTNQSDGRTIWEIFKDVKYLGNTRIDPCSRILKRELSRKFIEQFSPDECIVYLGFDWTEMNRFEKAQKAWLPYIIKSPMCDAPYLDKEDMKRLILEDGIELPRLYKMGFAHNNCGGGCVKAGIGHFAKLLDEFPERYAEWEKHEEEIRQYLGKDVTILRRTKDGVKHHLTLKQLREERQSLTSSELCDIGGCNCFQKQEIYETQAQKHRSISQALDAMSSGIPVVATDTGALHELLTDERGFLVPSEYSFIDVWGNSKRDMINVESAYYQLSLLMDMNEHQLGRVQKAKEFIHSRKWSDTVSFVDEKLKGMFQVDDDKFLLVVSAYKTDYKELGFIPKSSLYDRYYKTGNIKFIGSSFIMIGPQRRKRTRIYSLWVHPEQRRTKIVHELLDLLPSELLYYVRCTEHGVGFWKFHGMNLVSITSNNWRKRNIYELEGHLR